MGGEVREGRWTHSTPSGENCGMTSDNPKVQGLQNKQQTARTARRCDGEKQASIAQVDSASWEPPRRTPLSMGCGSCEPQEAIMKYIANMECHRTLGLQRAHRATDEETKAEREGRAQSQTVGRKQS